MQRLSTLFRTNTTTTTASRLTNSSAAQLSDLTPRFFSAFLHESNESSTTPEKKQVVHEKTGIPVGDGQIGIAVGEVVTHSFLRKPLTFIVVDTRNGARQHTEHNGSVEGNRLWTL